MTLINIIRRWAEIRPEATAYKELRPGSDATMSITYHSLLQRVLGVAAEIDACIEPGERVLIMMPNSIDFMVGYLGCLAAGAIAVPVPVPRSQGNNERLKVIIGDCRPGASLINSADAASAYAEALGEESKELRWLCVEQAMNHPTARPRHASSDAVAMLQYTSGSTASPRGVKLTHGNLLQNQTMIDASFGLKDEDVVLGWLPLFHDMGLIGIALHPIYKGACGFLLTPDSFVGRPLSWLRTISNHGATVSGAPNFAYELCARLARDSDKCNLDLSRWRIAFSGSERVRPETLVRFEQTFGECGFRKTSFLPCYGMAEATLMISGSRSGSNTPPLVKQIDAQAMQECGRAVEAENSPKAVDLVSVGRTLPGETVVIVEPGEGRRLHDGEIGEIWVAGPNISEGYWGSTEDTRIRPEWDAGRAYLRTGDLGFKAAGELFITGRLKDLIIIRGRNIAPEDIETVAGPQLAPSLSGRIAAFSVEAEGEEHLVIAFETTQKRELPIGALAADVANVLGSYFEIELHALVAVKRGTLPLTSSGKLRRNHIRTLWSEGGLPVLAQIVCAGMAPTQDQEPMRAAFMRANREEARAILSRILIQEIRSSGGMEHQSEQELCSSSLPGLGLGSLQIIRLIHRIDEVCGVRLTLSDGFEVPTLDALVNLLLDRLDNEAQSSRVTATFVDKAKTVSVAPLSLGQEGIWFAQQLSPRTSAWQIARAAEASPAMQLDTLNRALTSLVRAHPELRTTIDPVQDARTPNQRLSAEVQIEAQLVFCASATYRDVTLRAEAAKPFDLSVPPLLRVRILRAPECRDLLVLIAHHILSDLWSLSVLMQDLLRFYSEASSGEPQTTEVPGPSFLDHVLEERAQISSSDWQRRLDFWKLRLGGMEDWTWNASATVADHDSVHSEVRRVKQDTTEKLRHLARRHHMSLQMVLFAAFQFAIAALERRDGGMACIVTSGRARADRRRMVGYFANLLPFLVRVDRRATTAQWLRSVRQQMLEAYANELPYEEVVRNCTRHHADERRLKYAFVMQDEGAVDSPEFVPFSLGQAGGRWKCGATELTSIAFEEEHVQFPVALYAGVDQDGLVCRYKASTALVTPEQTRALAHMVGSVLDWLTAEDTDHQRLSELEWCDADERRQFDERAEVTRKDAFLRPQHILDSFDRQCMQTPDRIALEFEYGSVTYAHLQARVLSMASYLCSRGIGRETIVGICMQRSVEMVVAVYSVLRAGGAYLPLDPEHPLKYLRRLVSEAEVRYIVGSEVTAAETYGLEPEGIERGGSLRALLAGLSEIEFIDVQAGMVEQGIYCASAHDSGPTLPDQLAYVIFTSGSTGAPKGAMNTHGGIVNRLLWMQDRYQLDASDVLVQKTPFTFDVSVWELFWPLMVGARLVVAEPRMHKDPGYLADLLTSRMVSVVHFVPSMLRMFLLEERSVQCRPLRTVICSGEALPTRLVRELAGRLAVRIENLYGPTEASIDVTFYPCNESWPGAIQPIGEAIANTRIYVLDSCLELLPPQVTGTLFISGVGLGRGYLANPSLTAQRFGPDPWRDDGARMYNTGDLGLAGTDLIEFYGRIDTQIKLRGLRIELSEIEAVLEQHEAILSAVVVVGTAHSVAMPLRYVDLDAAEPSWQSIQDYRSFLRGELAAADPTDVPSRLIAYCVLKDGAAIDMESVQQWVRDRLPEQNVPAAMVVLEQMPISANGKLDKAGLPEPDSLRPQLHSDYLAPRNARERLLAEVWERTLDVREIGIRDNFFALGGDSILALRLISDAAQKGIVFDLATLFSHPTIEQLTGCATIVNEPVAPTTIQRFALLSPEDRRKLPHDVIDAYPLAAVQAGLIFHEESAAGSGIYKDVFVYRICAPFDVAPFRSSIAKVVDRHEVLRSSIDLLNFSVPLQLVHPSADATLEIFPADAAGSPADIRSFVAMQRRQSFEWSRPPFLHFAVRQLDPNEFELFVTFHDLLLDGWSASLLVSELLLTYDRLIDGHDSVNAVPLRVRFADYIAKELEASRSAEARAFYVNYLADAPEHRFPLREHFDLFDDVTVPRFAVLDVPIPVAISERLKSIAAACGVGVKHVLLAAHVAVLSQVFGEREILTGLESNGRLETGDGERVIGMHLNTVPFRIRLSAGRWIDLIADVYRIEQSLIPLRRYSYANLQRTLGAGTLVDAVFNYVHFHDFRRLLQLRHLQVKEARGYGASHFKFRSEFSTDPFSGRIHLCLECDTCAVGAGLMQDIGRYFTQVLEAVTADSNARFGERSLSQVFVEPTVPGAIQNADIWLISWQKRLQAEGERIAFVHGQRRFSHASIQWRARKWAQALVKRGVGPENCVGVLVRDPIEYSLAILAIHLAGGAYVPLNPSYPPERNRQLLTTGTVGWVIIDEPANIYISIAAVEMISPCTLDAGLEAGDTLPGLPVYDPDQLSYGIYTSGSTGVPKCVMVSHANLWFSLQSRIEYYKRPEPMVFLMIPPFAFDSSVGVFFWSLAGCHELVFPETDVSDLLSVLRTMREERVTHLLCTPSYYSVLLTEACGADLESLNTVIMAGESLSVQLVREHHDRAPWAEMFNEYGPTEGTVWSSVYRCGENAEQVPVGRPRGYTSAQIIDRRGLASTPGQLGELVIGGAGVTRGYMNAPAATAAVFIPDSAAYTPGSRAYTTGDLARAGAQGAIHLLGRNDRQVKINGFRVELDEIEHAIRQLPGIETCAVVYDASALARMTAYVVTRGRSTPDLDSLRATLPIQMIPARILQVETLPRNANGKIDYHRLRDQGEQLSEEWQIQRIINEVEQMTQQDVLSALTHSASSPVER